MNTLVEAKDQLKVAQILEMLIRDDTALINNDSVKPKPFADVNRRRSNLNPSNTKFYVPSDPNLIHNPQCPNPNNEHVRPSTSYYIPRNLNNQVETSINSISSYSTPHILYPNIIVKPPRNSLPKDLGRKFS